MGDKTGRAGTFCILIFLFTALAGALLAPASAFADSSFPELNPPVQYRTLPEPDSSVPGRISKSGSVEWIYHKTEDGEHPNGMEQQQVWFVNRARSNPEAEGIWLATETDSDVSDGRDSWHIDPDQLMAEFAVIEAKPPVAFDRRLYEASRIHSENLIERDSQDHDGQVYQVDQSGFVFIAWGGVVYSWSRSGLYAHAGFNIDWGPSDAGDGMQDPRGHRETLMSMVFHYTNVGIASVPVDPSLGKEVGPFVTTGNYCLAYTGAADHFNTFIVGTVWTDANGNGWYDPGEGHGDVTVTSSLGGYYAVTSESGGYAIPITSNGTASISFSGGGFQEPVILEKDLQNVSILVDILAERYYRDADDDRYGDPADSILSTFQPEGYVLDNSDCDDSNSDVNPGAVEYCDGIDNNCNSEIDEGLTFTWYKDADGDSFGNNEVSQESCENPPDFVADNRDCDDNDFYAHPGRIWYKDADDDGYSDGTIDPDSCVRPDGYKAGDELEGLPEVLSDCDDSNSDVHPGADEYCDGIDNNCNSEIDEDVIYTWYQDADRDGFGNNEVSRESCEQLSGYVDDNSDCDDDDSYAFPGQIWYKDADDDGYSDGIKDEESCIRPQGFKAFEELLGMGDEDDNDSSVFPSSEYLLTIKVLGDFKGIVTSELPGIDCGESCSASFLRNSWVNLSVEMPANVNLVRWSLDDCNYDSSCRVEMSADMEISVEFINKFPWIMFYPVFTQDNFGKF